MPIPFKVRTVTSQHTGAPGKNGVIHHGQKNGTTQEAVKTRELTSKLCRSRHDYSKPQQGASDLQGIDLKASTASRVTFPCPQDAKSRFQAQESVIVEGQ